MEVLIDAKLKHRKNIRIKMFAVIIELQNMKWLRGRMEFDSFSSELKLYSHSHVGQQKKLLAPAVRNSQWTYFMDHQK